MEGLELFYFICMQTKSIYFAPSIRPVGHLPPGEEGTSVDFFLSLARMACMLCNYMSITFHLAFLQ
jgi:hypothetical protein